MNWEYQNTALKRRVAESLTWEQVDRAVTHDRNTRRVEMLLNTSSTRLFAVVATFSFIHEFLTSRRGSDSDEWCSTSASKNMLFGLAETICLLKRRVEFYTRLLELMTKITTEEGFYLIDSKIMDSRKTELADPDKKIWSRLYEEGQAPEKIIAAYKEVKHLLPDEAVSNYKYRTGLVSLTMGSSKTDLPLIYTMSAFNFYQRFIRSDITQTKSNKLSEMYSESFEILPNTNIRVPRRLERYFNVGINTAKKHNLRFPSNYIRAMVYAYHVAKIFGGAFCGVQTYLMGFILSSTAACGHCVLATSFSCLKTLIKESKKVKINKKEDDADYDSVVPESVATAEGYEGGDDGELGKEYSHESNYDDYFPYNMKWIPGKGKGAASRKIIAEASTFSPARNEKAAITAMRTTLAEHEPDGFMAEWLSHQVSRMLRRKVSAQYALLFLVNWMAYKFRESGGAECYEEDLRKLSCVFGGTGSSVFGLTFHHESRLVVPVVGFGSGMTNRKLKMYATHCINGVVKKLIVEKGVKKPDVNEDVEELKKMDLEQLSSRFFRNNDVMRKTNDGEGAISMDKERKTLDALKGEEFVPNERRRKIHEEEYAKSLNVDTKLRFRFGVCGYQHPLPASSDKKILVSLQFLKHRQLYSQRESAAAANWYRIIQFFFPKDSDGATAHTPTADLVRARLSGLNRYFVKVISKALKYQLPPCERVFEDIMIKFNSDILTLGREPGIFLRTKVGLVVQDHARQAAELAVYNHLQYNNNNNSSNKLSLQDKAMEVCREFSLRQAHGCVIAREHSVGYEHHRPFLPTQNESRLNPIPFFGIENPIFPDNSDYQHPECIDNTASRGMDHVSEFWLKETNMNLIEALVSRGVLSEVALSFNNLREIVSSKETVCTDMYRRLRDINHKELASDKPRKYDPTPWSSKNTGQTGRSTTEFSPNSVIVLSEDFPEDPEKLQTRVEVAEDLYRGYDSVLEVFRMGGYKEEPIRNMDGSLFYIGGVNDIFLAGVESQRAMAQNDIMYPEKKVVNGTSMINAPNISPVFRYAGKQTTISLKHSTCIKKKMNDM